MASINELNEIYKMELRKHIKSEKQVVFFEQNKMMYLLQAKKKLEELEQKWNGHYHIFVIKEAKERIIMSLVIIDKLVNHYVTRKILEPKLSKYLDIRNVATRKNMGVQEGRRLLRKYMVKMKNRYGTFSLLKIDISKYFYHISHEKLLSMMESDLEEREYCILKNILSSTNEEYVNETIQSFQRDLPIYERGVGLPIGNMTSQFLAIYYLNRIDHKIIHDYHIPCYVRYMDDFILLHQDREYLKEVKRKIEQELNEIYQLKMNERKTKITSSKEGVVFLGYHYQVKHNKILVTLPQERKKRVRNQVKMWKKKTREEVFASYQSLKSNRVGKKYYQKWMEMGLNEFKN